MADDTTGADMARLRQRVEKMRRDGWTAQGIARHISLPSGWVQNVCDQVDAAKARGGRAVFSTRDSAAARRA